MDAKKPATIATIDLTENAVAVLQKRYFKKNEKGEPVEKWNYPEVTDNFRLRHRNLLHCSLLVVGRAQVA